MNLAIPKTVEQALAVMKLKGDITLSEFAKQLNMPLTTVFDRVKRAEQILDENGYKKGYVDLVTNKPVTTSLTHSAKILFWDIETSTLDLRIRQYDLRSHKGYHHYKNIERDWHILGAAWKWMDSDKTSCISVSSKDPMNDEGVVRKLHEILSEADILVAHNGDAFDVKKFNARALYYGLKPIMHKAQIDTLKEARKSFKITSNALGYLGQFLKIEDAKLESPDWNKILLGDAEELANMRVYNKQDVVLLEKVYFKLRGWMKSHPNLTPYNKIKDVKGNDVQCCKNCGSVDLVRSDKPYYLRGSGKRQHRFECLSCGHESLGMIKKVKTNG